MCLVANKKMAEVNLVRLRGMMSLAFCLKNRLFS